MGLSKDKKDVQLQLDTALRFLLGTLRIRLMN